MKLKTASIRANGRRRRGRGTSLWNALTGRWGRQHRLPAHVTGESDWEVEVPQIRMSRAFAVMLVLHIVAVGGLFAFRIWGREDKTKEKEAAANDSPGLVTPSTPEDRTPSAPELPAPAPVTPGSGEPLRTYVWNKGDTLPLLAARFGVTMTAIREANPDKKFIPGEEYRPDDPLVIPRAGRIIGGADTAGSDSKPAEIYDPSKSEIASTPPPPRAHIVPEPSGDVPPTAPAPSGDSAKPVAHKPGTATAPSAKTGSTAKAGSTGKPASSDTPSTKKKPPVAKAVPEPATPARTAGQRTHVVNKGDTVFNVAKRYGISADDIAKANGLDSNYHIRPGQQLRIPVKR